MSRRTTHTVQRFANTAAAVGTASFYDRVWPELGTNLDYTDVQRVEFVVDALAAIAEDARRPLEILDLGCGRGWMAPFVARFGPVTGIDFSKAGIDFARTHYSDHGVFVVADPDKPNLGLAAGVTFDVVVCSEVLEHCPDHAAHANDIAAFLCPGGWCLLTTPNGDVWDAFKQDSRFSDGLQPIENWATTHDLRQTLMSAGFDIVRHEGRPVFGFCVGVVGQLQRRRVARVFNALGLQRLYFRLIRSGAVYQVLTARKR